MTAVTGAFTAAGQVSAEFTSTEAVSDVLVNNTGRGLLILEAKVAALDWVQVEKVLGPAAFPVSTSSQEILYRFRSAGADVNIKYYLGP